MKRSSFQRGSVQRKRRKSGPDVYIFRHRTEDGRHCSVVLGTVREIPNESVAWKIAAEKYPNINESRETATVAVLIRKFETEALPERRCSSGPYRSNLKRIRQA